MSWMKHILWGSVMDDGKLSDGVIDKWQTKWYQRRPAVDQRSQCHNQCQRITRRREIMSNTELLDLKNNEKRKWKMSHCKTDKKEKKGLGKLGESFAIFLKIILKKRGCYPRRHLLRANRTLSKIYRSFRGIRLVKEILSFWAFAIVFWKLFIKTFKSFYGGKWLISGLESNTGFYKTRLAQNWIDVNWSSLMTIGRDEGVKPVKLWRVHIPFLDSIQRLNDDSSFLFLPVDDVTKQLTSNLTQFKILLAHSSNLFR